jgi:hypothetical protein
MEETVFLLYEIQENPGKQNNVKHCTHRHQIKFHFPGLMPEHQHRSTGSEGSEKGKKKQPVFRSSPRVIFRFDLVMCIEEKYQPVYQEVKYNEQDKVR